MVNKKIQGAVNPDLQQNTPKYSREYYIAFFSIMIATFITVFWLCNYPKLKEMFQVVTIVALSMAIAEYVTRKYLKL